MGNKTKTNSHRLPGKNKNLQKSREAGKHQGRREVVMVMVA